MSDQNEELFVDPGSVEDVASRLTHRERALRDLFVKEYLTNYNALEAAIRVGYGQSYAKEYAVRFMNCPYVMSQISKMETTADEASPDAMRKMVIRGLIREANYTGPGASAGARVAAFAKLAAIQGLDAPKKSIHEMTGPDGQPIATGGVFVVPGVATIEEWAAVAEKQQADLVAGKTEQVQQAKAD
jgi:hypothetical protein